MTEMKEGDKVPFFDAPVSSDSLFGPAGEGFAECFTETQKSSQAMRHFLPKRTSSSAACSRPRPELTQQTAKPTYTGRLQTWSKADLRPRQFYGPGSFTPLWFLMHPVGSAEGAAAPPVFFCGQL